jgi:hypothetical protein
LFARRSWPSLSSSSAPASLLSLLCSLSTLFPFSQACADFEEMLAKFVFFFLKHNCNSVSCMNVLYFLFFFGITNFQFNLHVNYWIQNYFLFGITSI